MYEHVIQIKFTKDSWNKLVDLLPDICAAISSIPDTDKMISCMAFIQVILDKIERERKIYE